MNKTRFSILTKLICILFICTIGFESLAQIEIDQVSRNDVEPHYFHLLKANKELRVNRLKNQEALDLVEVYLTDSILTKRTERHQVFGAAMARVIGRRWQTINGKKVKFVGRSEREVRIPGSERLTEYDVNFDMYSDLPEYQAVAYEAYQEQERIGRNAKKYNYDEAPFEPLTNDEDLPKYELHNELTPPKQFREMLNEVFYPCIRPNSLLNHPNFGDKNPCIGMYGTLVADCNHDCHPEIHPYEWIWWLNLHPNQGASHNTKVWLVGLFREGSNRFPNWSPAPRTGVISLPFIIPANKNQLNIHIEHLVYSKFSEEGFKELEGVPSHAFDSRFTKKQITFSSRDLVTKEIQLSASTSIKQNGYKIWFTEVNYDDDKKVVTGKLNLGMSVEDLYTAKVVMSH